LFLRSAGDELEVPLASVLLQVQQQQTSGRLS
jgi:hypothetical protein